MTKQKMSVSARYLYAIPPPVLWRDYDRDGRLVMWHPLLHDMPECLKKPPYPYSLLIGPAILILLLALLS